MSDYDDAADRYCPKCGHDTPGCGCDIDVNTMSLMQCPALHHGTDKHHQWWRAHGETSTICLHRGCARPHSVVIREPKYAPAVTP